MSKSVFLTGMSGFIGKEIAIELLNRGYDVHGSMRFGEDERLLRQLLAKAMGSDDLPLTIHKLELTRASGWAKAISNASVLIHAAAPLKAADPSDPNFMLKPALEGTKTVLNAAKSAGIEKMIMTSSVNAMTEGTRFQGKKIFNEDDWSNVNVRGVTNYARAKTLSEKMAWDFAARDDCPFKLTTLLPGLTMGRIQGGKVRGSLAIVKRLVKQLDPVHPNFGYTYVDVRDVARLHVDALENDRAIGERIALVNGFLWHREIAEIIDRRFPQLEITFRHIPSPLARLAAPIRPRLRTVMPNLDRHADVSNAKALSIFGGTFIPLEETIVDTVNSVLEIIPPKPKNAA
ncbi:MAG: NAD-dependent epimerase/dehydratase family protein [Pseudomonadota bacterium]